jgi:hypothetical protein
MTGIFDELKEANNDIELDDLTKDEFLSQIDTPKNQEGFYLDAFEGTISFNGIRQLKRPYTKLKINKYQQQEILACHNDYFYFRKNYCKILTKSGIGRPEPRDYQERLEMDLVDGDDVIAFFPRQSGKTVTIATFLLWRALTAQNINIGIAANVMSLATEVLDKIKKIYIEMPIWLQPGLMSWNKRSIELDNGCKIMTAASNSDAFRGYSLSVLYVDETAFIRNNLFEEFMDSVMPAMAAIQDAQAIFSSTANGLNHFYWMVEGARKEENGYKLCEASWTEVPRWNKNGTKKLPEEFKREQVAKSGDQHFQQNFGNEFLGSSATLVNGTALKNITPMKDEEIIFNSLFNGLKIFEDVKEGHNYILTSDPKQAGIDSIGLHVIDVTNIPFVQVASAKLDESFLVIPNRVFDLGTYYNNAFIVQENNIEANLINVLHDQLEYEGEIFRERKTSGKGFKNIWGIRTTTKTKKMMTSFLKKFVEDGLLKVNDKSTLDEMFNFIEKKNGTYSAEEGYHDDLVMSLMLVFAPFFDIKNWDDFKGFSTLLEKRAGQQEKEEKETAEFLDLGFAPDDNTDESPFTEGVWENESFGMDAKEMFQQDMDDRGW